MTDHAVTTVCAVVVTYQPDTEALLGLLDAVMPQVGAVVVVDNASNNVWTQALGEQVAARGVVVLSQCSNRGLAAAQNIGIDWARSGGFRQVLLLDQDSEPGAGMVASLLAALNLLSAERRVAAVGPRFHDAREHRDAPFVRLGFPLNRKVWCDGAARTVACDFLISSGALIPMEALDGVGPMDAGLFIDNVDLEWSFRACARGFVLHGVCEATMKHRLGDARRRLPLGMGQIVVHGPARLYYIMRNRLLLYRMPHTPRIWIAQDLPRMLIKLFLFGVVIGPRAYNIRCMLRGLWDGVRARRGACPEDLLQKIASR